MRLQYISRSFNVHSLVIFVTTLATCTQARQSTTTQRFPTTKNLQTWRFDRVDAQANYLEQFGYLTSTASRSAVGYSEIAGGLTKALTDAIRAFQRMANIPETGIVDEETKAMMAAPRCGNKDMLSAKAKRRKRFIKQGSQWSKRELKWGIERYTFQMDSGTLKDELINAFRLWQDQSPISFEYVEDLNSADIIISFVKRQHGDGVPFDGPGGTLAHAFFPEFGGNIHFDDDEYWTKDVRNLGYNLLKVAVHEMGHSLGLLHSQDKTSIMAPFYGGYNGNVALRPDDISGIHSIYGTDTSPEGHSRCTNPQFDGVINMNGNIYAFQGDKVHVIGASGIHTKGIKTLIDLPITSVDAAEIIGNELYLFKHRYVYRLDHMFRLLESGTLISDWFPGLPYNTKVDAVFTNQGLIYIFSDYMVYTMYTDSRQFHNGRPISNLNLANCNKVNAALKWQNSPYLYLFCGTKYSRYTIYNEWIQLVTNAFPRYPRKTGHYWLNCPSNLQGMTDNKYAAQIPLELLQVEFTNGSSKTFNISGHILELVLLIALTTLKYS